MFCTASLYEAIAMRGPSVVPTLSSKRPRNDVMKARKSPLSIAGLDVDDVSRRSTKSSGVAHLSPAGGGDGGGLGGGDGDGDGGGIGGDGGGGDGGGGDGAGGGGDGGDGGDGGGGGGGDGGDGGDGGGDGGQ